MKEIFKGVFYALAMWVLRHYRRLSLDLARIEVTQWYLKAVQHSRLLVIGAVLALLGVMLLAAGFILFHVALFTLLPWSPCVKGSLLMALGLIYMLIPLLVIRAGLSEKNWLKYSKANELVARAARDMKSKS